MKRTSGQHDYLGVKFKIASIVPRPDHMDAGSVCFESVNVATVKQSTVRLAQRFLETSDASIRFASSRAHGSDALSAFRIVSDGDVKRLWP